MDDLQEINPWSYADRRYRAGQEVQGIVTRVTQLGVFVQIEPGIEGIIYAFELGQGASATVGFPPGREMRVFVRSIDITRKRLELSLQDQLMPGLLEADKLPAEMRRHKQPSTQTAPDLPGSQGTDEKELLDDQSCPTCQRLIQTRWRYCVYCGASLHYNCPACGLAQPDLTDARYCYACGQLLASPKTHLASYE